MPTPAAKGRDGKLVITYKVGYDIQNLERYDNLYI